MLIHTGHKPHVCTNCGKAFTQKVSLNTHMLIHTGHKPHVCTNCGKAFTQKVSLNTHMLIHTGHKPHVCTDCGKAFRQKANLNTHLLSHTGHKPHICTDCGKMTPTIQDSLIRRHQQLSIADITTNMPSVHGATGDSAGKITDHPDIKVDTRHISQDVDVTGNSVDRNVDHTNQFDITVDSQDTSHAAECSQDGSTQSCISGYNNETVQHNRHISYRSESNQYKTLIRSEQYSCTMPGKTFKMKADFKQHMLIYSEQKTHVCMNCGKEFKQKTYLDNHMRIHTGQKPHVCIYCGKAFTWKSSLDRHNLIHTGQKPHVCSNCGKAFREKIALDRHILTHTGQKPHVCTKCGKAFTQKINLRSRPEWLDRS
ncbi:uncharacterized protein LOC143301593 [Babylonia areolata]|uniref:uncharacterized protein LOC143301593 n=1 Tax=Babylonia areolata TaxID=304850 RepID=UPI003FD5FCA8